MSQFASKTRKDRGRICDRVFLFFCLLGMFFPSPALAWVETRDRDRFSPPSVFLLTKTYEGFQDDVNECDFTALEGWFYWYIDTSGLCTTVMVANQEEAIRQSREILEYSFSVIRSGYGVNFGN